MTSPIAAVVRPTVVGRCDLDVAFLGGLAPLAVGSPIGHEIIGEVVAVGDDVVAVVPGQLVFLSAQISCGTCQPCRAGRTGRCVSVPFAASYGMGREGDYGCGLADLVAVPYAEAMLSPLPVGADPLAVIGLADTAADAWRAVAPHLLTHPAARVLVIGGMPAVIGLHAVGLAVALGAASVDYSDPKSTRCEIAEAYGGRIIESPGEATAGGYDIVVVANPSRDAFELAVRTTAPGGVVVSTTPTLGARLDFNSIDLYHRGISWVIGRPDCRHAHDGVITAWAIAGFRPNTVPTKAIPWDEAPQAWSSEAIHVAAVRI